MNLDNYCKNLIIIMFVSNNIYINLFSLLALSVIFIKKRNFKRLFSSYEILLIFFVGFLLLFINQIKIIFYLYFIVVGLFIKSEGKYYHYLNLYLWIVLVEEMIQLCINF